MPRTPDDLVLEDAIYSPTVTVPGPVESSDESLVSPPLPQESPLEDVEVAASSPSSGGESSDLAVVERIHSIAKNSGGMVGLAFLDDTDIHRLARLHEDVFAQVASELDKKVIADVEDFRSEAARMGPPLAPLGSNLGLGPTDALSNYDVLLGQREDAMRRQRQIADRLEVALEGTKEYTELESEFEDVLSTIVSVGRDIEVTESLFRKNPQIAMVNSQHQISALDMILESTEG